MLARLLRIRLSFFCTVISDCAAASDCFAFTVLFLYLYFITKPRYCQPFLKSPYNILFLVDKAVLVWYNIHVSTFKGEITNAGNAN